MKIFKCLVVALFVSVLCLRFTATKAQCSMCTLNAENSVKDGNTEGNGLNRAILFLLAAPYVAVAGIGYLWYKKFRKKNVSLHIKDEKISLN